MQVCVTRMDVTSTHTEWEINPSSDKERWWTPPNHSQWSLNSSQVITPPLVISLRSEEYTSRTARSLPTLPVRSSFLFLFSFFLFLLFFFIVLFSSPFSFPSFFVLFLLSLYLVHLINFDCAANFTGIKAYNSVSDQFCNDQKSFFGDKNAFEANGGLKAMDAGFDQGVVLVMSLWVCYY